MTAVVVRADARALPLADVSVDAIVTDPPYELGFMGRAWDRSGVAFQPETWAEALRVAKPGAYLLAFGGTRTYHRLTCAIEDAGWIIEDSIGVMGWVHRWPTNLVFVHHPDCQQVGERTVTGSGHYPKARTHGSVYAPGFEGHDGLTERSTGDETVPVMECVPVCPVAELDAQSGVSRSTVRIPTGRDTRGIPNGNTPVTRFLDSQERGHSDSGGASRFYPTFRFNPKAAAWERPQVQLDDGTMLRHTTVKPLDLMRWLVRLATPPGGTVLDPFAGSGPTLQAAQIEGFRALGVELDGEHPHTRLIAERLSWLVRVGPDGRAKRMAAPPAEPGQMDLLALGDPA